MPWDIKGIHVLNETFEVNYSIPLHHSASLQFTEDEAKVHKEGPPSRKFQLGMFLFILVKKTSTRYLSREACNIFQKALVTQQNGKQENRKFWKFLNRFKEIILKWKF